MTKNDLTICKNVSLEPNKYIKFYAEPTDSLQTDLAKILGVDDFDIENDDYMLFSITYNPHNAEFHAVAEFDVNGKTTTRNYSFDEADEKLIVDMLDELLRDIKGYGVFRYFSEGDNFFEVMGGLENCVMWAWDNAEWLP